MTQSVKKMIKEKMWALVLVAALIICAIPAHQVFGDAKQKPTEAVFYVLKREYERPQGVKSERQAKYEKVGTGTIAQTINISEDDEAVAANIVTEPDGSSLLNDDEKIVWYVCKKETDGWHVDGEIVKISESDQMSKDNLAGSTDNVTENVTKETEKVTEKETEKVTEKVTEKETEKVTEKVTETVTKETQEKTTESQTAEKKTTTAHFALLKSGYTRPTTTKSEATAKYSKVGDGKIYNAVTIENDDAKVKANIAIEPDVSKYLGADEEVVWYVCKKEADGWHIDGEIVKKEAETEPSGETVPPVEPKPEMPSIDTNEKNTTPETTEKETESKTQEVTTEKTTEKETESKTQEQTTEKTTEKVTEKETESKTQEQTTEKTTEKVTEKETESKTQEQTTEKTTEKATEKETESKKENETNNAAAEIRAILKQMILTGDMTTHDISKYGYTYRQVDDIWNDLAKNECYLAVHTYYGAFLTTTKDSSGKILTIRIYNADANFQSRYSALKAKVATAMSGLDKRMSDLEKALYLYDFLMENTYYKMVGMKTYYSGSVLGDGYGVCSGYADAYEVLLHEAGITAVVQTGQGINHAWSYINIDGQWYHADPTWDDWGEANVNEHMYFMRNDTEYAKTLPKSHKAWYCSREKTKSTSTKYSNWFVHDVVGKMYYSNTYWYYYDKASNSIKSAKIDGSNMTTVVDGSAVTSKIKIVSVKNSVLTYTVGGTTYTKTVK